MPVSRLKYATSAKESRLQISPSSATALWASAYAESASACVPTPATCGSTHKKATGRRLRSLFRTLLHRSPAKFCNRKLTYDLVGVSGRFSIRPAVGPLVRAYFWVCELERSLTIVNLAGPTVKG